MKSVSTKVSIGSDQVKPELRSKLKLDGKSLADFAANDSVFTKDGRKTVELGTISVNVPENEQDVLALLASDAAMVIKTLGTQLVTNEANAFRKSFTKDGDAKLRAEHREAVRRWLFTPVGMPYAQEYMAIPASDVVGLNNWLDQKWEEHLENATA